LHAAALFHQQQRGRVVVDAFEVKLPQEWTQPQEAEKRWRLLEATAFAIDGTGPPGLSVYYEIPAGPEGRAAVAALATSLRETNEFTDAPTDTPRAWSGPAGLKLRCGGLSAAAFPAPAAVAATLAACRAACVPWKAPAG